MSSSPSDSSLAGFFSKHKTAIIATVAAGSAAVGAYIYYRQLQSFGGSSSNSTSSGSTTSTQASAKKNKKKNRKHKKSSDSSSTASTNDGAKTGPPIYPVDAQNNPDLSKLNINELPTAEKDKIATALKDKGNELFRNKDFEKALTYYNSALELKKDPVFYSNISACYVSLNQLDKVIEMSSKALELKPDYSKALLRRASAYESLERYDDAMFDLSVLSLNNDFSGASIEPMLERNLNKQALKVLKEKLESTAAATASASGSGSGSGSGSEPVSLEQPLPSNTSMASFFGIFDPELEFDNFNPENEADVVLKHGLTELYGATKDGFTAAENDFTKAYELFDKQHKEQKLSSSPELNQKLAIAAEYLGIFKFLKNDIAKAQELIQRAIKLHPRVKSYIYMALITADRSSTADPFNQANTNDYFEYFKKALDLDPNCSATYYHRGQLYFITQDYTNARKDFIKAKELDESNIFPYIQLACLDYRAGSFQECEKQFDIAKKRFPVAPEVPTFYAEILADKGDLEQASKQYDFARRLEEEQQCIHVGVAPLIGKATVLARQPSPENFKEASRLLQLACERDPRSEQAKVGLAQLKLQEEDVEGAIKLFEEAADLARSFDEKLQATTFAEAAKVQRKIRADPVVRAKVEKALADYRAQGMI